MLYKANHINIKIAEQAILDGNIIIYPTDTIYGFGVDATNSTAIKNLNKLKKRVQPYSIIVDSFEMLSKYALTNHKINLKLNQIFPGPYTAILNSKKSNLSQLVNCNMNTIGIRLPKSNFINNLVKKINRPIITTSVNIHQEKPINNLDDIQNKFSNLNIFYGEVNHESRGSTIIDYTVSPFKIIRSGDSA